AATTPNDNPCIPGAAHAMPLVERLLHRTTTLALRVQRMCSSRPHSGRLPVPRFVKWSWRGRRSVAMRLTMPHAWSLARRLQSPA
ncbi:MAG: hypothetical protein PHO37_11810, partial [Kiritimatiellae bacterium]|nr:hypothetical protein [Kiritimatiellia bacterium]